jgi:uncharacterized protein involved in exopolysaccharide biosynthesis
MGGQNAPVNYLAILKSRRLSETIIRRFDLLQAYQITDGSMEQASAALSENFNVDVQDDGSIRIDVSDKDTVRAAAMANAMVDVLNEIAIELGVSEARNNRQFLEKRVADARAELGTAEEALKTYQQAKGMPLLLTDDARSAAAAIGELYTRRMRLDIELSVLLRTTGEDNEAYRRLLIERGEVERRLSLFPQVGMQAFRLYRNLVVQQKVLEFLVPLYEQARIDEQKDIPVVLVLDKAVPAERKDRPRRMLLVAVATVSALLIAIIGIVVRTRFRIFTEGNPERVAVFRSIFQKRPVG